MNLTTKYLGLTLNSPIVVSASPLSEKIDNVKKMEDSGAAAIVLHSLFEEQILLEQLEFEHTTTAGSEGFAESLSFFPQHDEYRLGPEEYLDHIQKAKSTVQIPIIASLNGTTNGGWTSYAKKMEEAGADAIELNVYSIPSDFNKSGSEIEDNYINILKAVKSAVKLPVAMKLSPFFSNMANMAKKIDDAGVDGLVLFNRFYQPDIDLEEREVVPNVLLSHSSAMRLPMRWIAMIKDNVKADLAATSGIHTGEDVIKMLMVGANVAMLCSSILKSGISHIKTVENQMKAWMQSYDYASVEDMIGSMSQRKVLDPSSFERAQYMKALTKYKLGF
jgi:dihydroorotate dehydrogenase (fumarate)